MQLIITEKNDAAKRIADLLSVGKPKADKVFDTPVYRFEWEGQECVILGLRGHILEVDYTPTLMYNKRSGWYGLGEDEKTKVPAVLPDTLAKPPYKKKKPFAVDSVDLKSWKLEVLPYLTYGPLEKKPKEKGIIRSIKNLAAKADDLCIATDFDREGELIGMDALNMALEANPNLVVTRARYSSFTKTEIANAFSNLVEMDMNLAYAGESRQFIDLIWGAVLTRYLTIARFAGYGNVRPSGRVQTPTLALVVAREKERLAFVPEDYWVIKAGLSSTSGGAHAEFEATHSTARFKEQKAAEDAYAAASAASEAHVKEITRKSRKVQPPAPFSTTSLIAAASAEGLSPGRTMRIAESLYMAGYISYPRVDNTVYPDTLDLREVATMLKGVPQYSSYVDGLLAQGELKATRGKTFDTDHPPIYPTAVISPDDVRPEEWKLYNLVARRFLATLSGPATVEGTKVNLDIGGESFDAKGDVLVNPGFRGIYPYGLKKDEQLPTLEEGEVVKVEGVTLDQKQTEPPSRYSAGRLIQEMEKAGLGTKSTRHSIIDRLVQVRYIQNDPVEPTQLGIAVIDALGAYAPHITTPDMTAQLEGEMSSIAAGTDTRDEVVMHSRKLLEAQMNELIPRTEDVGEALAEAVSADARVGTCPACGEDLLIKQSAKTRSSFIGCSGWKSTGDGCNITYPLPQGRIRAVEETCVTCGKPMIQITQFRQKPLVRCVDPECASNQEPALDVGECPGCRELGKEGRLIAQRSPKSLKRFIRCTNYDECNTSYPLPQRGELSATNEACEACGAPKVVVKTARGPWEICPNLECPLREEAEEEKKTSAAKGKGKAKSKSKAKSKK